MPEIVFCVLEPDDMQYFNHKKEGYIDVKGWDDYETARAMARKPTEVIVLCVFGSKQWQVFEFNHDTGIGKMLYTGNYD